jgi:Ca-activated chloride channel family protein
MSLRRALLLCLLLLSALTATAQEGIWVSITTPADGDFAIGEVEIAVEVVSHAGLDEVEFRLDGRPIGTLTQPPFVLRHDLGDRNAGHRFSVVARDVEGNEATDEVRTKPLPIAGDFEVDLRQLYVSATRDGERVLDLGRHQFEITDEGSRQVLVTFARGDIPFTAVLLLDASASMFGDKIRAATAGAAAFIDGMRPLDLAQVMIFSDQLLARTPITGAREVLAAGLGGAEARGGTALQDHLFLALKLLEERQGRRVVVLLSDGIDTHSVLDVEQMVEAARTSNALIYWIRFARDTEHPFDLGGVTMTSAWKAPDEYGRQIDRLVQVVRESGGDIIPVASVAEIEPVFVRILEELRSQYVLGYYPDNRRRDRSWHRVKVAVDEHGVEVRAPRGYLDR